MTHLTIMMSFLNDDYQYDDIFNNDLIYYNSFDNDL